MKYMFTYPIDDPKSGGAASVNVTMTYIFLTMSFADTIHNLQLYILHQPRTATLTLTQRTLTDDGMRRVPAAHHVSTLHTTILHMRHGAALYE